jgi:hypothetical protein
MYAFKNWGLMPIGAAFAIIMAPVGAPQADGFSVDFDGFIRTEFAVKTTSDENVFNQRGNLFNGRSVDRLGINMGTGELVPDTVVRDVPGANNDFNMMLLRGELGMNARFSDQLRLRVQARAVFDPNSYSNFDPARTPDSDPAGPLQGRPNLFEYRVDSGGMLQARKSPSALEFAGEKYLIDFPSLYLDYQSGPLNVRFGNQQIAWGQSLFFRVLDVPNGLDMRRHGLLDYVPEEFADKRVPAPALRVSYTLGAWEMDSFVQHFRPSIYGNPNTPYNVIPGAFTVHDLYGDVDRKLNLGARMRGPVGPFLAQFMAVRRYGPDGTFRWTESGVNRDIPGLPGTGLVLEQTAFEVDPSGVVSAEEWYTYGALARLDARDGLNSAIIEFPAAALLGAAPVGSDLEARITLDTFFQLSGGLRGHIAREYHRETVLGGGLSYVFEGRPDSLLDQLIANIEVQYADGRAYTNPTLSREFLKEDEWTIALVLEKYHRFSQGFPATYFVAQGMRKSESDIFGRHLSGMGGSNEVSALDAGSPSNAKYLAFAVQQPFPNLVWRFDLSLLYDMEGGLLSQAGLRWRPRGAWTVEAFYTRIDGNLRGRNRNFNALSTVEWADEFTLRLGYQF